jgi:hypothetical protein
MSEATEFVQIAKNAQLMDENAQLIDENNQLLDENAQLRAELEEVSLKLATIREILFEFMNKNFI